MTIKCSSLELELVTPTNNSLGRTNYISTPLKESQKMYIRFLNIQKSRTTYKVRVTVGKRIWEFEKTLAQFWIQNTINLFTETPQVQNHIWYTIGSITARPDPDIYTVKKSICPLNTWYVHHIKCSHLTRKRESRKYRSHWLIAKQKFCCAVIMGTLHCGWGMFLD